MNMAIIETIEYRKRWPCKAPAPEDGLHHEHGDHHASQHQARRLLPREEVPRQGEDAGHFQLLATFHSRVDLVSVRAQELIHAACVDGEATGNFGRPLLEGFVLASHVLFRETRLGDVEDDKREEGPRLPPEKNSGGDAGAYEVREQHEDRVADVLRALGVRCYSSVSARVPSAATRRCWMK